MPRLFGGVVLLAVLPAFGGAGEKLPDGKWLPLFNGKNLDGWMAEGAKEYKKDGKTIPVWSVSNGVLTCSGRGYGFLRYAKQEFGDFVFHVEYRIAKKGNSGIGIRTVPFDPKQSRKTRPSIACYEIQLVDDAGKKPSTHSTGSLYRHVAPSTNPGKPAGEWNAMDIYCQGPRIRIFFNGVKIIDVDQTSIAKIRNKPLKGYLCLQNHGRFIEFRDIRVLDLKK